MPLVYLLHLDPPYRHARHYVGWTGYDDLTERLNRHREGRGARLLQAHIAAGGDWTVALVCRFADWKKARAFERRLKRRAATRHCRFCSSNPTFATRLGVQDALPHP